MLRIHLDSGSPISNANHDNGSIADGVLHASDGSVLHASDGSGVFHVHGDRANGNDRDGDDDNADNIFHADNRMARH